VDADCERLIASGIAQLSPRGDISGVCGVGGVGGGEVGERQVNYYAI